MTPYVTPISGACLEKGVGIGDHILMVLDIPVHQIVGVYQPKIEKYEVRRLKGKIPRIQKRYIKTLKKMLEDRGYYGGTFL